LGSELVLKFPHCNPCTAAGPVFIASIKNDLEKFIVLGEGGEQGVDSRLVLLDGLFLLLVFCCIF
jgi:hypothetical protein